MLLLFLAVVVLFQSAPALTAGSPSGDATGYGVASESTLAGGWHGIKHGFHGYREYFWVFGRDGHFAYYAAGLEPPQGGGAIDGSVSEYYAQGRFRVKGDVIECYDMRADTYFAWGDTWKYYPYMEPDLLVGMLLFTPLQDFDNVDDFSFDFKLSSDMALRLDIDRDNPFGEYDMAFDYIRTAADEGPEQYQLKIGDTFVFYEYEKQSIPFRWRYLISDESLIGVSSDEVMDTSGFFVEPGGDSADRKIEFIALSPGECVIMLRYGKHGETDWDGDYDLEQTFHIVIVE